MDSSTFDVIIVGAGVVGSSTGYYLTSNTNKKVLLIEQFDRIHIRGSSRGASRLIRKAYKKSYYMDMVKEAYEMWSTIEEQSGATLHQKTGSIIFAEEKTGLVQRYAKSMEDNSVPHQVMPAREANEKYSDQLQLPEDYLCLIGEDGGILRASKAVATLQDLFIKNGGTLIENTQVTGLLANDDETVTLLTASGSEFNAKKLIVTAGAWTNKILQSTGLTLPLTVKKAEVFYWKVNDLDKFSCKNFPIFGGEGESACAYGMPVFEYPGLMKICPYSYTQGSVDPDERDAECFEKTLSSITGFIQKHFKGIDYSKPAIHELCMCTFTPNEDPFLDRHPDHHNIIIGAGFSGHIFKKAPVIGKILSELALDLPPSYDLSYFKITR